MRRLRRRLGGAGARCPRRPPRRPRRGSPRRAANRRCCRRCCARASCGRRSTSAAPPTSPTRSASAARCPATSTPTTRCTCASACSTWTRATKHWVDLASARSPSFVAVGRRQRRRARAGAASSSCRVPGKPAVELRGVVEFQWRRGKTVLQSHEPPDERRAQERRGRRPAGLQRRHLLDRLRSARASRTGRGSLVMIPSTPIAVSRSIMRRVVDRPHVELAAAFARPRARARG